MKGLPTLRAINMSWLAYLERAAIAVLLLGIAATIALAALDSPFAGLGIVLGAVSGFLISLLHGVCFYHLVKCPDCRAKLNKFKNGKNVPMKQAHTQLENGYGCRLCGWKPSS